MEVLAGYQQRAGKRRAGDDAAAMMGAWPTPGRRWLQTASSQALAPAGSSAIWRRRTGARGSGWRSDAAESGRSGVGVDRWMACGTCLRGVCPDVAGAPDAAGRAGRTARASACAGGRRPRSSRRRRRGPDRRGREAAGCHAASARSAPRPWRPRLGRSVPAPAPPNPSARHCPRPRRARRCTPWRASSAGLPASAKWLVPVVKAPCSTIAVPLSEPIGKALCAWRSRGAAPC